MLPKRVTFSALKGEVIMADKREGTSLSALGPNDVLAIVAAASQAQADKVRLILERFDHIADLDPKKVQNISALLNSAKADGGCGIGCW